MAESLKEANREAAFACYKQCQRLTEVSNQLGISYMTALRWSKEGNWEERLRTEVLNLPALTDERALAVPQISAQEIQTRIEAERQQLEVLEMRAVGALVLDDVRPTSWKDILATLKFVAERRDILLEKAARLAISLKKPGSGATEENVPEAALPLTNEQHIYVNTLVRLVSEGAQQLQTVESAVAATPAPAGPPSVQVRQALADTGLVLATPTAEGG